MASVFLGLGSNLAQRENNIAKALSLLKTGPFVISKESPIYETEPSGFKDQPDFLNMVALAETALDPRACLGFVQGIENRLGRTRPFKNAARTIDIDILFYNSLVINSQELTIPHPQLANRGFVLVPLADIAPDFCHPILKKTVKELLTIVDISGVRPWNPA